MEIRHKGFAFFGRGPDARCHRSIALAHSTAVSRHRVETKTIGWLRGRNLPVIPTVAFRTTRNLSPTALRLPSIYNTVTRLPITVTRTPHLALTLSLLSLHAMLTGVHDGWTTPGRLYVLHTARSFRRSWQLHRTVEGQSTRLQYAVRRAAMRPCGRVACVSRVRCRMTQSHSTAFEPTRGVRTSTVL